MIGQFLSYYNILEKFDDGGMSEHHPRILHDGMDRRNLEASTLT